MVNKHSNIKKIYRSENNRVLGGVCGGLAAYFDLDTVLIRLVFVILAFAGGSGIPLYLVMWIIIPSESKLNLSTEDVISQNTEEIKEKSKEIRQEMKAWSKDQNSQLVLGLILLFVGFVFLLHNLGFVSFFSIERFWPVVLIIVGLTILLHRHE